MLMFQETSLCLNYPRYALREPLVERPLARPANDYQYNVINVNSTSSYLFNGVRLAQELVHRAKTQLQVFKHKLLRLHRHRDALERDPSNSLLRIIRI
ncbi:hypothetical protein CCR75_004901 [Bremia lactucae]|uniref:Uncharacterized protein n=1 Tax=Bremia lactucae TaxID=4779 RepID=A0A976FG77_BRELC|nr:hypothetical protein CCR75_004901 [Bremia lactucae]